VSRKRLLFLHTGGTLGMIRGSGPGPLSPAHYARDVLPYVRGLEELADIEGRVVCNLDSSDMQPALWEELATRVHEGRADYDGFVILHGTDTMAYTACALSLLLAGLRRPVVLTGSQRPIAEVRSDARQNLVHATLCATLDLPEVGVCFGRRLFRGNRCTKTSIQSFDAFESPGLPPLVELGVDVLRVHPPLTPHEAPGLRPGFHPEVAALSLFPGVAARLLDHLVATGSRAVVLRGFGEGNLPQAGWPDAIARATDAGVAVVVVSQCRAGAVRPGRYEGSSRARDAGAVFAGEMTEEMAVVKAMWVLHRGGGLDAFRAGFAREVAGEGSAGG
jgi:L-asparaginase